jgi:translation initiation factor 2 beta subunit (eIF-2beta)/eIF-5
MATTEGEGVMGRWRCAECNSKELTITLLEEKLIMKCEQCDDQKWVKRG